MRLSNTSWLVAGLLLVGCGATRTADEPIDAGGATSSVRASDDGWTLRGDAWLRVHNGDWSVDRSGVNWSLANVGAHVALRTTHVGRGESVRPIPVAEPRRVGARVELDRGEGVREWVVSHPSGLEQGFDLATPPAGTGALTIKVAVDGLEPRDDGDSAIALSDAGGARRMTIRGLFARDAAGTSLIASMHARGPSVELRIDDRAAQYPIVIDPVFDVTPVQTLATPTTFGGWSDADAIAIDGTTMFIGHGAGNTSPGTLQAGAVTIFQRGTTAWSFVAALDAAVGMTSTGFGRAVALQGNLAIVAAPQQGHPTGGAQGALHPFTFDGTSWKREPVIWTSYGPSDLSMRMRGTTAIVGISATYGGSSEQVGATRVYEHGTSGWTQTQVITPPDGKAFGRFGGAVAFDGSALAVSAESGTSGAGGRIYLYDLGSSGWAHVQTIPSPVPDTSGGFAFSLAMKGNLLFVGAPDEGSSKGAVYLFTRSGSTWTQTQRIVLSPSSTNGNFGSRLAFDGTNLLVAEGYGSPTGKVTYAYLFKESGGVWSLSRRFTSSYWLGPAIATSEGTHVVGINPWMTPTYTGHDSVQVFTVGSTPQGAACTTSAMCETGYCVDGVCCDVACTGECQSCAVSGSVGSCRLVTGQPRAPRPTCVGAGTTCGGACSGTSAACSYPLAGSVCGAGCVGSQIAQCNGSGVCSAPIACPGNLVCGTSVCKTSCASTSD
jgi:hypothetical protein